MTSSSLIFTYYLQANSLKLYRFILLSISFFFTYTTSIAQNTTPNNSSEFSYTKFEYGNIVTTHALKYTLKTPKGFTGITPYNFKAVYNKHPFNVSIATIISKDVFIMISAEKVTDSSGILDYSYHKPVRLSGEYFYMKDDCVPLTPEIMKEAKDLKYIEEKGFDFGSAIYIRHYFKNTSDGTYEYVLNYGERVSDCSAKTIDRKFMKRFNKKIIKSVNLTAIKQ